MNFESYGNLAGNGVVMPAIKLASKYYKKYNLPETATNKELLRAIAEAGMKRRGFKNKEYNDRLDYELGMFDELKYTDYVLAVWDICNFADENDIARGPGRGSAASSLTLCCLGVTEPDPLKYGLFFERFVSRVRSKYTEIDGIVYFDGSLLCDIDLDFDYNDRQRVIEYISEKYKGQTAHILTVNTLSGKLCFKEVMKIYGGFNEEDANEISDNIPKEFGNVKPLDVARLESQKFGDFCTKHEDIYKIARKLENLRKNFGVHPSGIAIAAYQINDMIPLQLTGEGKPVTGVEMGWTSELCVKFDILGLRTLSVVKEACRLAKVKVSDLDVDHPSVYAALQVLDCPQGVFQIEADSQFAACRKLKPASLQELSDLMAIARPGAMDYIDDYVYAKKEGTNMDYGNSGINKILGQTKGVCLYQESLMQLGARVFGLTLEEAETLRKIVGKKQVEKMPEWKDRIYANCTKLGLETKLADFYWKVLDDSKNYSFAASHAISYAFLAAQTLYLKFNYPQEFFTALLKMAKFEQKPQEEIAKIGHELKNFNIRLLAPDLILSHDDFSMEGGDIRFGLSAIKGLNEKSVEPIEAFKNKPRTNKFDVFINAFESKLNMGALSSLIQSGALSSCGSNRPRMVLEAQTFKLLSAREQRLAIEWGPSYNYDLLNLIADLRQTQKLCSDGKIFMKDSRWETFKKGFDKYKELYQENNKHGKMSNWWFEKQLLGYSYSEKLKDCVINKGYTEIGKLGTDKKKVKIVCYVEDYLLRKSAKGNRYMKLTVSDETGQCVAILADSPSNKKLTDYLDKGGVTPSKKDVISIEGQVKDDGGLFIDRFEIMNTKIYMKISELK